MTSKIIQEQLEDIQKTLQKYKTWTQKIREQFQVRSEKNPKGLFSRVPQISMDDKITHKGSKTNLLGNTPSEDLVEFYSNEKQIDSLTPPTFLVHATDDKAVPVENSIHYYIALKDNNVPVEMHIYENGGHGFGLGVKGTSFYWVESCEQWLNANNFLD